MTLPSIAGEAETLVRALRGVTHASIRTENGQIHTVHVTARDAEAARHMAAHVRSALLAGLAAPVLPGRIHVRVAGDDADAPGAPAPDIGALQPRDRLRLLHGDAGHDERPARDLPAGTAAPEPVAADPAPEAPVQEPETTVTRRPRLVSVDAERPGDGRVLCRVAIAYRTRVHSAEAIAVDLPGAAAQAAAQATVRALLDAGIPGLELGGLREVEIAGRDYVVVALRRTEPYPRNRSGSAPIIGSAERSAAEATVAAAQDMT